MSQTTNIVDVFNKSGKIGVGSPKRVKGFQLLQPYVYLNNNNVLKNHGDGSMNVRDKLKNGVNFKDWVIVDSLGKNAKYDDQDADQADN